MNGPLVNFQRSFFRSKQVAMISSVALLQGVLQCLLLQLQGYQMGLRP